MSVIVFFGGISVHGEDSDSEYHPSRIIVSMGDSYSAGEGIEPFYGQKGRYGLNKSIEERISNPDWLAHRSKKAGQEDLNCLESPVK